MPSLYAMSSAGTVFLGDANRKGTIYVRNDGCSDNTLSVTPIPAMANTYASSDAVGDFKSASLYVGDCARVRMTESLRMLTLTLEADTVVDLGGKTLTVYAAKLGDTKLKVGTYAADNEAVAGFVSDSVGGGSLVVKGYGMKLILR